ncbi:MAG: redoxin domain-containing protein [Chloroflexota bacterium]|nr:MAG: redoxin domain-containing protein [Chloroflexota bacterium]
MRPSSTVTILPIDDKEGITMLFDSSLVGLHAPELTSDGPWINSPPLHMRDLRGRVVLIDFWTYSCVNCLRTLPYVKSWHEKYAGKGLTIIGVHTPEFGFEKDSRNVERFVAENSIRYPVVLDNDYHIWNAYANHYWPRKLLIDANGIIRYDHAGEGAYAQTEDAIQALLRAMHPGLPLPKVEETAEERRRGICFPTTPELYCGYFRGRLGNTSGYVRDRVNEYTDPGAYRDGKIYLRGAWQAESELVRHTRTTAAPEDYVAVPYHAFEVNAVMQPTAGRPIRVYVTRDGAPIPVDAMGADLVRSDGATYVEVSEPRMYNLIEDPHLGSHLLRLSTDAEGLEIYAFTFGGCASA